jgi:iron complex transport system substrate-binding protein
MKRFFSTAAVAAILFSAAACGDDSASDADTSDSPGATAVASEPSTAVSSTEPSTADGAGDAPQAIISLAPTQTEILFAIGAGEQVIAVDQMSNYPAEALDKPHDLSGFEPNVEAIAALDPDLVVIGDDFKGIAGQLQELGIDTWASPAPTTIEEAYEQIEQIGAVTGHIAEAAELVGNMQADIAAAVAGFVPVGSEPLSYYHELDPTLYTVTGNTFVGQVYALFGLANVADDAEAGNDYPQLNAEFLIAADPDLVFLADANWSGESPATVAARPGWDQVTAVQNGTVIVIDDDIASRWGPRLVDFVEAVAAALATVPVA